MCVNEGHSTVCGGGLLRDCYSHESRDRDNLPDFAPEGAQAAAVRAVSFREVSFDG